MIIVDFYPINVLFNVFISSIRARCRFAYQKLRGFRPILSARSAQIFFITVGTLLVALGIPILIASLRVKKYIIRYDDAGPMANLSRSQQQEAIWNATDAGIVYSMDIAIQDTMEPPVRTIMVTELQSM